jgi:hypothetical protein
MFSFGSHTGVTLKKHAIHNTSKFHTLSQSTEQLRQPVRQNNAPPLQILVLRPNVPEKADVNL